MKRLTPAPLIAIGMVIAIYLFVISTIVPSGQRLPWAVLGLVAAIGFLAFVRFIPQAYARKSDSSDERESEDLGENR